MPVERVLHSALIDWGMHCHVLLAGFAWPTDEAAYVCSGLALGALETLLARGRRSASPGGAPETWLLERFGVEHRGDWPAGALSLLGDGGAPGEDVWMRADPVHLRIERNQLVLADHSVFRIAQEEAEALAESINRHLGDQLVVHPVRPQRWYARLPECPDLETSPLSAVRGRAVDAWLPHGGDSAHWIALANELQMLLHDHPVNAAREDRGEHPVNSVWLWGAGRLPAIGARPFRQVAADDPLARGLAQASGAQARDLPPGAQAWLAGAGEPRIALVVLDALAGASRYGDAEAWRDGLAHLEQDWFAPLLGALRQGRIGMLSLHLLGDQGGLEVEIARSDLRYFWRRSKPIADWLR